MKEPSIPGQTVKDFLQTAQGSDKSDLARKLLSSHPEVITSFDQARGLIRYYTGAKGKESRKHLSAQRKPQVKDFPHLKTLPNVLILDVETAPMRVYVWGLYKQRISHSNIITDWNMLSWAGKWLYNPEVLSDTLT